MTIIDWIKNYLNQYGIEYHLVPHPEEKKTSLHCRIGPAVDGGVILSGSEKASEKYLRNIVAPTQVLRLTEALQKASTVPLLVAIDHEGGFIVRLKESFGFPPTVSHHYLGALDDQTATYNEARKMAKTLTKKKHYCCLLSTTTMGGRQMCYG